MPRVLVIEDNDDFRKVIQLSLEAEGFEVASARNGDDGLRQLAHDPAHVVITDIFMPGKEGIETIAELRRRYPDTPIIAISGRPSATDFDPLKIAQELGAAKTLKKPFELDELLDAVAALTRKP